MASANQTTNQAATDWRLSAKRDFTVADDETGWNYRLVFHSDTDGEQVIFVNRQSMAGISAVFHKMFLDPHFADSKKEQMEMQGKSFKDFYEFIDCIAITPDSDHKDVNLENMEILLQFADEYQVGSLKQRCVAFIDRLLSAFDIDKKEERNKLIRVFIACHKTGCGSLLPDSTVKKLSRFPSGELGLLQQSIEAETANRIMNAKIDHYARLVPPPAVNKCCWLSDFIGGGDGTCNVCHQKDSQGYFCLSCPLDIDSICPTCYCTSCFDTVHVAKHYPLSSKCPDCKTAFKLSTVTDIDRCNCVI